MSRLMRGRRRAAPDELNTMLATALNNNNNNAASEQSLSLSPRSEQPSSITTAPAISPRQAEATPLPSPLTSFLTTTTQTLTYVQVTAAPTALETAGAAVPSTTSAAVASAATIQSTAVGANQSNPGLVAGVTGAAGFSFVSLIGFCIVRRRRLMYDRAERARLAQSNLKMTIEDAGKRAPAAAARSYRPYSSSGRMM